MAATFSCGHCPGIKYPARTTSNAARKDWDRHNARYHMTHERHSRLSVTPLF